jgi:dolichol-phosphate mannosyltransferase
MRLEKDFLLSLIIPLRNDAVVIPDFIANLHTFVSERYENFEIILIDDDSSDGTAVLFENILKSYDCLRYIRLSRSYGIEVAIAAGFETAIGDYTMVLLPAFDPIDAIPEVIGMLKKDANLVIGRSEIPLYGLAHSFVQKIFCKACKIFLGMDLQTNTTYLLGLNRSVLNSVNRIRDRFRYIKSLSDFLGTTPSFYYYRINNLAGKKWGRSIYQSVNLAIDVVVSNSVRPLRYISLLGLAVSGFNFLYVGYIALIAFFKSNVAEGWVTLSTQSAVSFFVLNMVLAVVCEYLGRVLVESKERPFYFVAEEKNSSVLIANKENRLNVVGSSVS